MSQEPKLDEIPISDRIDREAMERGIFSIHLNGRTISVDATVAYRTLVADDEIDLSAEMDVYKADISPVDLKAKAQGAMVELAYKAFRVPSYSNDPTNGFTESEMEIVLFDFLHYCMTLQKKTNSTPTITPSSDGIGSTEIRDAIEPENSDSACGLTEDGSKLVEG